MSQELGESDEGERKTLPIEKGFPIEKVTELSEKEARARRHYRPIYTMHKWWARRLGCVFRTICLYSLLDDPSKISIKELKDQGNNETLDQYTNSSNDVERLLASVDMDDPMSLWELYSKDVTVEDKRILDPFMGGGTSLVEASRFGAEVVGNDLNPVAWFVTKKELDAGTTELESLESAFEEVRTKVAAEIQEYFKTPCPNSDGDHDADVMYNFWVKKVNCTSCDDEVRLFKDYRVGKARYNDEGYNVVCPDCGDIVLVDDWKSESTCDGCEHEFIPQEGTVSGSDYVCRSCGQKYSITDAIQEQDGFQTELFAVEYYCSHCDEAGHGRSEVKGYKSPDSEDIELAEDAQKAWEEYGNEYVPNNKIREGHMTSTRNPVFDHGYQKWMDFFTPRQLLCHSKLLEAIDEVDDANAREYLLMTFTNALSTNSAIVPYQAVANKIDHLFRSNSFDPPMTFAESNLWGTKYGRGTFASLWDMLLDGVEYAKAPTERYVEDGETKETLPFETPIGENSTIHCGDVRELETEEKFDAIITDPPYYDNIIYSEISDYYYVWQRLLLEEEYEQFKPDHTPRAESIVANPAEDKDVDDFEEELRAAFEIIRESLKDDGVLAFTYHHSDSESWGELLTALCDVGFEVTATYPITADVISLSDGENVEFDIIIVARPAGERDPISWNSLRRNIYRTAQKTRQRLEENRELSRGDIGVVEMGRCFHEYSKHHGEVERAGETMTAKDVVDEIYGVIQHGSDIGEIDVFLDLLETPEASYNDLNKLCRGTNATPERMEDMRLYRMDDGFTLGTWDDETRIAYIQSRVESDEELTDLDKAQFLRYRWEHGKSVSEYLGEWEVTDNLRELCEGLADATGDDTYRNILESRLSDFDT